MVQKISLPVERSRSPLRFQGKTMRKQTWKVLRATDCRDLKATKGKYSGSTLVVSENFYLLSFKRSTKESKTQIAINSQKNRTLTQIIDREHNASHRAEKLRNEASLASGNTTAEESGGGGAEWSSRLKSQCHKKENFNSSRRGGVKRKRWS